ncbi:uncharacterized protein HMPREF1541_03478 [Cyphellophora europaea CBS 101466]|uniref:Metallo-beta-lactamase domain-containing protein n=1 Tax=Cyphellophora europaea (strain CBS 101466) TaxID=1220924 RepID=W2RYL8_CYPE1|nr:uncharacterized protein HMPREF1541_03478 [Cyphellophora europaea CBS 101466]ETN41542.1 hypothetical protein HMPREF1541_03478 [Cyphellophora europaea CBS 101466]
MPTIHTLPPLAPSSDKSHHKQPGYKNPWPSWPNRGLSFADVFRTRFGGNKPPYVPVPADRAELVQVRRPDFSPPPPGAAFKVTWIGHASFLLQCALPSSTRTLNILLDPVFSERTSPFSFFGPKRYTPTPCTLAELLDELPIDVVCISHNHYDHADTASLKAIYEHRGPDVLFCVALGNSRWLLPLSIPKQQIWEGDWWDRLEVSMSDGTASKEKAASIRTSESSKSTHSDASIRITCTPCQHSSARSPFDRDADLWCSFALEIPSEVTSSSSSGKPSSTTDNSSHRSVYFSGDTGYRTIPSSPDPYPDSDLPALPVCPAFAEIGEQLGPFDLALLPIGLCKPRAFMAPVHCNPADSMCVHRDVKAKRSVGMHYGTVRGGLSEYYEDVRTPPREWREEAEKMGLKFRGEGGDRSGEEEDWEIGLMDVGESLVI